MARYKDYDYSQGKFIPRQFDRQILPGTFEYSLHYLIDNEIDLSIFESRYRNDETGAPAYDPAILLKIILYAYSRGITSSRRIAQCCRENIIFMALSADTQPHFTTIADFISTLNEEIIGLFLEVLMICDEMELIGKEMFAVDGCKLPSNASKEWSGTKGELEKKPETFTEKMKRKIDSIKGRLIYNRGLGTAEPVFGNICSTLGLDRFTLRGKPKVNTQWLLYCLLHNLLKVHRFGPEFA